MEGPFCPSFENCQLVFDKNIVEDENCRNEYIFHYCKSENKKWETCKRLITKRELNFCPDFVLPDTALTPDEIIDKFDNENIN